jgi:hypothetical protein
MVDFGSEQGLSNFETAGIAGYVEDFKRAKTRSGPKDAVCGWAPVNCFSHKVYRYFSTN